MTLTLKYLRMDVPSDSNSAEDGQLKIHDMVFRDNVATLPQMTRAAVSAAVKRGFSTPNTSMYSIPLNACTGTSATEANWSIREAAFSSCKTSEERYSGPSSPHRHIIDALVLLFVLLTGRTAKQSEPSHTAYGVAMYRFRWGVIGDQPCNVTSTDSSKFVVLFRLLFPYFY